MVGVCFLNKREIMKKTIAFYILNIVLCLIFNRFAFANEETSIRVEIICVPEFVFSEFSSTVSLNFENNSFMGTGYYKKSYSNTEQDVYTRLSGTWDNQKYITAQLMYYTDTEYTELFRTDSFGGTFDANEQLYSVADTIGEGCDTAIRLSIIKPRYPVLFVHGFNSDALTWIDYYSHWTREKSIKFGGVISIRDKFHISEPGNNANSNVKKRPLDYLYDITVAGGYTGQAKVPQFISEGEIFAINFSNNNDISFAAQGLQLREAVNAITEWTKKEGVYIVAHSMGGLASRAYLQYFNDGKVKGLITIGTPHFGSFFAKLLPDIGMMDAEPQLEPKSDDLEMLNNFPAPLANINYFAIVVRGKNTAYDNSYSDDTGDGIVPTWSQAPKNWDQTEVIIEEDSFLKMEVHTLETHDPTIRKIVWDKLISW